MTAKYFTGFILSLVLTLCAYMLATHNSGFSGLIAILGILAITQLGVQLYFFLHLAETHARVKLLSFGFMALILCIIVGGSIWIMYHLNYNMMHMAPQEKDQYMLTQKDKGF